MALQGVARHGEVWFGKDFNTTQGKARRGVALRGVERRGGSRQGRDFETTQGSAPSGGAGRGEARQGRDLTQQQTTAAQQQVRWRLRASCE